MPVTMVRNKSGNILAKYQTMDNINIYDENAVVYDKWFDQHSDWFRSEVAALKKALPEKGRGIVVGMGSGRFAVIRALK